MLLNKVSVFDIVLIAFAVIGLIAVLGVAGMWVMHTRYLGSKECLKPIHPKPPLSFFS